MAGLLGKLGKGLSAELEKQAEKALGEVVDKLAGSGSGGGERAVGRPQNQASWVLYLTSDDGLNGPPWALCYMLMTWSGQRARAGEGAAPLRVQVSRVASMQ